MQVPVVVMPDGGRQLDLNPSSYPTKCTQRGPQMFYCTNCQKVLVSHAHRKSGVWPWLMMILLFILLLPFMIFICFFSFSSLQTVTHTCPNCGSQVGKVKGRCCM